MFKILFFFIFNKVSSKKIFFCLNLASQPNNDTWMIYGGRFVANILITRPNIDGCVNNWGCIKYFVQGGGGSTVFHFLSSKMRAVLPPQPSPFIRLSKNRKGEGNEIKETTDWHTYRVTNTFVSKVPFLIIFDSSFLSCLHICLINLSMGLTACLSVLFVWLSTLSVPV